MNFLYAAYIATWIIHGTYLAILVRKYSRIRREMESLKRRVTSS
jgi:CcmD family protein